MFSSWDKWLLDMISELRLGLGGELLASSLSVCFLFPFAFYFSYVWTREFCISTCKTGLHGREGVREFEVQLKTIFLF